MTDEVPVWDGFVRLFHWSLVALVALAWLTADHGKRLHEWSGHAIAGLIVLRLVWGFVGSRHARFGDFLCGPRVVAGYLRDLLAGRERRYLGHNPAGGAMIVALLAVIAATVVTGWLQISDAFWGSQRLEDIHEALATLVLVLVGLHVAGVVFESRRHGENLLRAMLTGRKPRHAGRRP